jgi:ubiquinol-cytochrome c reductase cytochrome b subunit
MRTLKSIYLYIFNKALIIYPTPINLNYFWNFGILAGLALVVQLITGILLAMHYTPQIDMAFLSVERLMREVPFGWFLRYLHANGASFFFIVVYIHISRGLYYGSYSYPRQLVWYSGVVIFILMMATAFLGYVLPWGQMSFWGATVITNLFSTIPFCGPDLVIWIWGGGAIVNGTLNRFFSLHYLLPFLIVAVSMIHILLLHEHGSNNPLGIISWTDQSGFYPLFYVKDLLGFLYFLMILVTFVCFFPNVLNHPDNFIPANPLVTPEHIVPEWYFLPFYAILRSIPHKGLGVLAMGASLLILFALPIIDLSPIRSLTFRPIQSVFFWIFVFNLVFLGWLGGCPVETPYIEAGQLASVYYFLFFILIVPAVGMFDRVMFLANIPKKKMKVNDHYPYLRKYSKWELMIK